MPSDADPWDVVIVGAGLSGINSAYLLQKELPGLRYLILEARHVIAGTWSFWSYPGARSDSSSALFRFRWHPWPTATNFADARSICDYAEDAVRAAGIDEHIRLGQRLDASRWSSAEQLWTLDVTDTGPSGPSGQSDPSDHVIHLKTRFLVHCSGYYSYDKPQAVAIPGLDRFAGQVVHPQFWPDADVLRDKRVVLIGSGATAVTILPHIVKTAAHVTMLQRSPSYVLSLPRHDTTSALLLGTETGKNGKGQGPLAGLAGLADLLNWIVHMLVETLFVQLVTRCPALGRRLLRSQAAKQLPPHVSVDEHFAPRYTPFDQRVCIAPDGDFYAALWRPNCRLVTGVIDTVTETGVRVRRVGQEKEEKKEEKEDIPADVIITATGLHMEILNNRAPLVDGAAVDIHDRFAWRGCMVEGVPNAGIVIGYTTNTWMPGAHAHFDTLLGVLRHMQRTGATSAWPTVDPALRPRLPRLPVIPNSSGYLVAARDRLPLSAGRYPWIGGVNWVYDTWCNLVGSPQDGIVYRTTTETSL